MILTEKAVEDIACSSITA